MRLNGTLNISMLSQFLAVNVVRVVMALPLPLIR